MPSKGNVVTIVVIGAFLIAVALAAYYFLTSQPAAPVPISTPKTSAPSKGTKVQLKTEYSNPFDKKTQYVNPFSSYKNPFDR